MESGVTHITFAAISRARNSATPAKAVRPAPVSRPKLAPAEMHGAHLANAIDKAKRENNAARLAELTAEVDRRGG